MLPSKELRELSKRVDICLSGKTTPKGCDIRFRQFYWLMVFDDQGELLTACRLADRLTEQEKKFGRTLPEGLVAVVDSGLKVAPSLEELERRYIKAKGSTETFEALREKVKAMEGVGQMRLADFLVKTAAETSDPGLARVRGVLVEAAACDRQVINHGAYARLRKSIEGFIKVHPSHPSAGDVIRPLADVGLKYSFDLAATCKAYASAWSEASPPGGALHKLSQQLLDHCGEEIARADKKLSRMKPDAYGRLRLQARLGRAQETLDGLKASKSYGVFRPIHAEWRRDAAAKLSEQDPRNQ